MRDLPTSFTCPTCGTGLVETFVGFICRRCDVIHYLAVDFDPLEAGDSRAGSRGDLEPPARSAHLARRWDSGPLVGVDR